MCFDVLRPKKANGHEVRDLRVVNLALMAKWRRRLLYGISGMWVDILVFIYGLPKVSSLGGGRDLGSSLVSS